MASDAQIQANQQNAQLSCGPKTAAGKAASSKNATRHGLSCHFVLLAHEDHAEFEELMEDVVDEHKPATQHQRFLVEQLAKTWWLLGRSQRLEARAFDHLAGSPFDPEDGDHRIVEQMFKTNPNALVTLQRYTAQAERSYYRAWKELKCAKQIQNEADLVARLDGSHNVTRRVMEAPVPMHPARDGSPADAQYGYLPSFSKQTQQIRDAARGHASE